MTDGGFDTFEHYLDIARVTGLALSPDGSRLVASISTLDEDGAAFTPALWELDPAGTAPARRLTRSKKGERAPAFHRDGSLLFVSGRDGDDEPAALWRLPRTGEGEKLLARPGAISGALTAKDADTVVVAVAALPGNAEGEDERRKARKDLKVAAILHTGSVVRHWDHDLGPDETRLLAGTPGDWAEAGDDATPTDLTPEPARALDEAGVALSPDGSTVVTTWSVPAEAGLNRSQLCALDTTTGERRVLADEPDASFGSPAFAPDGSAVVAVRQVFSTYDTLPRISLVIIDVADGTSREFVADVDVWPGEPQFSADGSAVFFLADERGHRPVFRLEPATGDVVRVTASGHYADLQVAPDGTTLFALRDTVDEPPRPVRLDATATDGEPARLPAPGAIESPGRLERILTTAADGTEVSAWLALPHDASAQSPAAPVLWVHGGPLSSWNGWSWRWNPWLMVGRGYAVLLPDPALSTGYGERMVERGWGQWGGAPFTDLMSITDIALQRDDLDETKVAAMGGSYGGYMANWIAGHTDRFRCIVTHASLWAVDQFQGTTDHPGFWAREWGLPSAQPERYAEWSPHHFAGAITTPMLVVHGDKDYRVPIGEGLRLWTDLQRQGVESKFLYYPDEGHWILKPGNARVWYETVWAWLDQHVHDGQWQQPELL